MKHVVVAALLAGSLTPGCYLGNSTSTGSSSNRGTSSNASDGGGSTGVIDASASGLPCDVVILLDRYCVNCHSATPAQGVTGSLLDYADLTTMARSDPSKTVAALALSRIKDGSMPPSPAAKPSASDIAALASWIDSGMMRESCTASIDAGTAAPNPYDTPLQCSSGSTWNLGNRESSNMHPGGACIACHSSGEGPRFGIAGTVFPTAHEPDDCNGSSGSSAAITVVITDATGRVVNLTANGVGNFYYRGALALPYHAKITSAGRERAMSAAQTSGDCNFCHTVSGASGAPGRIMAP